MRDQIDQEARSLIRSTAFAVLRNGTSFYEWLRSRRQADPVYSFLFGGIGTEYYKWCLANSDDAKIEEESERTQPGFPPRDRKRVNEKPYRGSDVGTGEAAEPILARGSLSRTRRRSVSSSWSEPRRSEEDELPPRARSESRKREEWVAVRRKERSVLREGCAERPHRRTSARESGGVERDTRRRSRSRQRDPSPRGRGNQRRTSPGVRRSIKSAADEAWGRPVPRRRDADHKQGRMYAWSDDENRQAATLTDPPKRSSADAEALRQKLSSLKQKLRQADER